MVEDITILKTDTEAFEYSDEVVNPDTSDWFEITSLPDAKALHGSVLDVSRMLDAPAGKHGFINRRGEDFVFDDGTKVNFWGCNIVSEASFLCKEEADILVDRISASGYNLVRFHHIDAPWCGKYNVFGGAENTMELNDEAMDKFGYFWAKLKSRGIYFMVDPMCSRLCKKENEGIDTNVGFKGSAVISEELQKLQKDYAVKLFTRFNPYSGTCLKDDPALVFVDIINEDSFFWDNAVGWEMNDMNDTKLYGEFCGNFTKFLREKYSSTEKLVSAWEESGKDGLPEGESLEDGVKIPFDFNTSGKETLSRARQNDMRIFCCECYIRYYREFLNFYRNELGLKCVLCGSNAPTYPDTVDLYANTLCGADFVDQHAYYAGTDWGVFWLQDNLKLYTAAESVISGENRTPLDTFSNRAVYGFPFVQSEWNQVEPNVFSTESMTLMAAYGQMKNWNPFIFAFLQGRMPEKPELKITFNVFEIPTKSAVSHALGIMFQRGDVRKADIGYYAPVSYTESVNNPNFDTGIDFDMVRCGKTGVALTDCVDLDSEAKENNRKMLSYAESFKDKDEIISVTGELIWNKKKKFVKINTPNTQACVGFLRDVGVIKTDDAEFDIKTLNANVLLTSLSDKSISNTGKMLLTAVARWRMTDMVMSQNGRELVSAGKAPMIAEPVLGSVIIKTEADYDVYCLDNSGRRTKKAETCRTDSGWFKIKLLAEYKTFNYEIVKK